MTGLLDNSDVTITDLEVKEVKFEDLVGDGKKFKTNDDIAKKIVHSDAHIQRLEKEAAAARETIAQLAAKTEANDRLAAIEDLLKRQPNADPVKDDTMRLDPERNAPLDEGLIEKILDARDTKRTRANNVKTVKDKLVSTFGREYPTKVQEAARNLNMEVSDLDTLAGMNPTAFYKLLGMEERSETRSQDGVTFAPPRNSIESGFTPSRGSEKNFKYYEAMRRSDPVKYHSVSTQWEMDQEAIKFAKAGKDFYE